MHFLKPIFTLIISILVFTGYLHFVDTDLLYSVQTRFYNPAVLNSYIKENIIDAELTQNQIFELQNKFAGTLIEPAVRNSFLYNQTTDDIYARTRIFGMLLESTAGLQSIQLVDSNGKRIHFSTSAHDIMSQSSGYTVYRNYNEDPLAMPYRTVSVFAGNNTKITMDEQNNRVIFSYPFSDSMDIYWGTALFTVSIRAIAEKLITEGRIKVSEYISVIGNPSGILLGSPETTNRHIHGRVSEVWSEGIQGRVTLDAADSDVSLSLISFRTSEGIFFGRLVNDSFFSMSDYMKIVLHLSIFLTFYLTVFLLINLKPNPESLVKSRIKNLREVLFEQLYVNKSTQERVRWILELEQRRDEIRSELKRNIKLRRSLEKNIDSIINKSWDELLAVIKSGSNLVLEKVSVAYEEKTNEAETAESFDEIFEIEIVEDIEELEAVEETEKLEEIEEFEDLEELKKEPPAPVNKGLLALARKIEFNHKYHGENETEELSSEMDIVSPFSSMFTSLNNKNRDNNTDKA